MILLVLAWLFAAILAAMIFFTTFNRWAGAAALSFPVIWGGPPVAHHLALALRGEAERFEVFGGQVSVSRDHPARLSGLSTGWLSPGLTHEFTLDQPGLSAPLRFRVTAVIVGGGPRDGVLAEVATRWRACPGAPGPSGLWRLTAAGATPDCPTASGPDQAFLAAAPPDPVVVHCEGMPSGSCAFDLTARDLEVTATIAARDLPQWRVLLADLRAVLAQSVTGLPRL